MLYAATRSWIHSWDEVGDNDLRIEGVDWEFLACEGAIYPEGSTLRNVSPFDYSLHPAASASILSRILELGSFAPQPHTEEQYLQAVRAVREANLDDVGLQVSDTELTSMPRRVVCSWAKPPSPLTSIIGTCCKESRLSACLTFCAALAIVMFVGWSAPSSMTMLLVTSAVLLPLC